MQTKMHILKQCCGITTKLAVSAMLVATQASSITFGDFVESQNRFHSDQDITFVKQSPSGTSYSGKFKVKNIIGGGSGIIKLIFNENEIVLDTISYPVSMQRKGLFKRLTHDAVAYSKSKGDNPQKITLYATMLRDAVSPPHVAYARSGFEVDIGQIKEDLEMQELMGEDAVCPLKDFLGDDAEYNEQNLEELNTFLKTPGRYSGGNPILKERGLEYSKNPEACLDTWPNLHMHLPFYTEDGEISSKVPKWLVTALGGDPSSGDWGEIGGELPPPGISPSATATEDVPARSSDTDGSDSDFDLDLPDFPTTRRLLSRFQQQGLLRSFDQ